jgi:hypothetical protein
MKERLELAIATAEAAGRASVMAGRRASPKGYTALKLDLDILVQDGNYPTENISRQWTAEYCESMLGKGRVSAFVASIRVWRLQSEPARDSDAFDAWDMECPLLWQVSPSPSDEERAAATPDDPPETEAELMQYKIDLAYDRDVLKFPTLFLSYWACDSMYEVLRTSVPRSIEFLLAWITAAESPERCDEDLGEKCKASVEQTVMFSRAYLVVVSDGSVLTRETYRVYQQVFVPASGKRHPEFFKLLASVSRKNQAFMDKEKEMVLKAATELELSDKFKNLMQIAENMTAQNICEVMAEISQVRAACRSGVVADFEKKVQAWLQSEIQSMCKGYTDEASPEFTIAPEQLAELKILEAHLAVLAQSEALPDSGQSIKLAQAVLSGAETAATAKCVLDLAEAVKNGDRSDLCLESTRAKIDGVRDSEEPNVKDAINAMMEPAFLLLSETLEKLCTEDDAPSQAKYVMNNISAMVATNLCTTEVDEVCKRLVNHACLAVAAQKKYLGAKSKANLVEFNKGWLAFRSIRLSKVQSGNQCKVVLRACLVGMQTILKLHGAIQAERAKEAENELQAILKEYEPFALGRRDGTSWKADIPISLSLKKVCEKASTPVTGLIHGPGKVVMAAKPNIEQVCLSKLKFCHALSK